MDTSKEVRLLIARYNQFTYNHQNNHYDYTQLVCRNWQSLKVMRKNEIRRDFRMQDAIHGLQTHQRVNK